MAPAFNKTDAIHYAVHGCSNTRKDCRFWGCWDRAKRETVHVDPRPFLLFELGKMERYGSEKIKTTSKLVV